MKTINAKLQITEAELSKFLSREVDRAMTHPSICDLMSRMGMLERHNRILAREMLELKKARK